MSLSVRTSTVEYFTLFRFTNYTSFWVCIEWVLGRDLCLFVLGSIAAVIACGLGTLSW